VENIIAVCDGFAEGYHEDIADRLSEEFAGKHVLVAKHHGVKIKTIRGKL
jgi:hypothetical protein